MEFRLRTLTLASAIGALGLASVVSPVHPNEKGVHGRHAVNANKNRHCVTDLSKRDDPTTCYDTFTAAIAAATGGRITDAPADLRVAMNDERFLARVYNTGKKKKKPSRQATKKKKPSSQEYSVLLALYYTKAASKVAPIRGGNNRATTLATSIGMSRTSATIGMTTSSPPEAAIIAR